MNKVHEVTDVKVCAGKLYLSVDGRDYVFQLANVSQRLAAASEAESATLEVSPAGYGIHWPLLDEDLSIDGLLGIKHEVPRALAGAQSGN